MVKLRKRSDPRRNRPARTTLPWGMSQLVDSLVGTLYGQTRAEVLRFMIISWAHNNSQVASHWVKRGD